MTYHQLLSLRSLQCCVLSLSNKTPKILIIFCTSQNTLLQKLFTLFAISSLQFAVSMSELYFKAASVHWVFCRNSYQVSGRQIVFLWWRRELIFTIMLQLFYQTTRCHNPNAVIFTLQQWQTQKFVYYKKFQLFTMENYKLQACILRLHADLKTDVSVYRTWKLKMKATFLPKQNFSYLTLHNWNVTTSERHLMSAVFGRHQGTSLAVVD